jgi:hypothetical protein
MNPFDPNGSLLYARQQMEHRQRSAAFQRMVRCCREVFSLRATWAALAALIPRWREPQVCATC